LHSTSLPSLHAAYSESAADRETLPAPREVDLMSKRPNPVPDYQQRRQAALANAREKRSERVALAGLIVGVATFALGVVTLVPWLLEGGARAEERDVRRATLIDSAYKTIADLKPPKGERLLRSARLESAMATLARYGEPIQLEADIIDLSDIELACGDYILKAPVVRLRRAEIVRARVAIDAEKADLDIDAHESFIVNPSASDRLQTATYLSGALYRSVVHSPGRAIIDVYGERSAISAGPDNYFRIDRGSPGKLTLVNEELNDLIWPMRSYSDLRDADAFPGEARLVPPLAVFERTPPAYSTDPGLRFANSFLTLCPQGVCDLSSELPADISIRRAARFERKACAIPEVESHWWMPTPDFDSVMEGYLSAGRDWRRANLELEAINSQLEALKAAH
jgi:hypothetical protein